MKTTFRQRLLTSTLLIGAASIASPGFAQDTTNDQPSVQAETDTAADAQDQGESIVVTGSRIARRDLTSSSPMAGVSSTQIGSIER